MRPERMGAAWRWPRRPRALTSPPSTRGARKRRTTTPGTPAQSGTPSVAPKASDLQRCTRPPRRRLDTQPAPATTARQGRSKAGQEPLTPAPWQVPTEVWERCKPAPESHRYIWRSGRAGPARGAGLRPATISGEPMAGAWWCQCGPSMARFDVSVHPAAWRRKEAEPSGRKHGRRVRGRRHEAGGTAYLCEGIGQAWACWKATGSPPWCALAGAACAVAAADVRAA